MLTALAAVLVAAALVPANGAMDPAALAMVTLGASAALAGLLSRELRGPGTPDASERRWTLVVLWIGVGASLGIDALVLPGIYVDPSRLGVFRPTLGALAALVVTHAWATPPLLSRVRFAAELGAVAVLGGLVIHASPVPEIDVWFMERIGASALLHGVNPYSVAYPNIYGPKARIIADALLSPDRRYVLAYPYTPLTLLLVTPAVAIASEPRWAMLAAMLAGAWAVRRLGRGSREANLAALFLLVQPRGLFVLEQSWTEPLVLLSVLGVALAVDRLRDVAAAGAAEGSRSLREILPVALVGAAAIGIKQYTPLLLVPLAALVPPAARLRAIWLSALGALAIVAPFLAWDPQALLRGVVLFQIEQPFRPDALSWPAALYLATGAEAPTWIAFVVAGGALAIAIRGQASVTRALLGGAVAWIAFVILNKQAFCNYYWLAVGLLCAAVSASSRGPEPRRP